jgi:hypothetical protein
VSIARVPFLPGVTDTTDQTYTLTGVSITGFTASGVGHVCATVPTIRALIRFFQNGCKMDSKPSSSYVKESTYESSAKRSYKTLERAKSESSYSEGTPGAAQQQSQNASSKAINPFGLSSIADDEENIGIIELQPVHSEASNNIQAGQKKSKGQPPTIVREVSGPEVEDSASDKAILYEESYMKGYDGDRSF